MGAKPWYDWVFRWRRAWDSNPRTVFGRQTISSRSRYDLFDSPPYISTVFRALRKCKKNTQEQYEILKFDPAKTLINQGFSAEKTARANAKFRVSHLRPLGQLSVYLKCNPCSGRMQEKHARTIWNFEIRTRAKPCAADIFSGRNGQSFQKYHVDRITVDSTSINIIISYSDSVCNSFSR